MTTVPAESGSRSVAIGAAQLGGFVATAGLLALIVSLLPNDYLVRIANLILVMAIAAMGVNVVLGYAGLFSIAHASLMAVGAYTSALAMMRLGLPFPVSFLAAVTLAGILSALIGGLGTRVQTNYFMLVTAGLHFTVILVIINEAWLTGGAVGIARVPAPSVGPWSFEDGRAFGLLGSCLVVVGYYFAQRLRHSRDGRAMIALRLNERAAWISGVPVISYRVIAMFIAGLYLGAAGAMFGHLIGFVGVDSFGLALALQLTLAVVIGGVGSNLGAITSVALLTLITQVVRISGTAWPMFYGIAILAVLIAFPRGLAGLWQSIGQTVKDLATRVAASRQVPPAPPSIHE